MSPLSLPVVVGTVVVGSPALYAALGSGTLSTDVALTRVLLCALGVWAVCSVVASLASRAVATNTATTEPVVPGSGAAESAGLTSVGHESVGRESVGRESVGRESVGPDMQRPADVDS